MAAERIRDPKVPLRDRLHLIAELGFSKDTESSVPLLIDTLMNSDPAIRAAAAHVVKQVGSRAKAAVPALVKLLDDEAVENAGSKLFLGADEIVCRALGRIGQAAVPALTKLLQQDETKPALKWKAVRALGLMGRKARNALPVVEETIRTKDLSVAIESACGLCSYRGRRRQGRASTRDRIAA
jgi:HEAT repeat protein